LMRRMALELLRATKAAWRSLLAISEWMNL